MTLRWEPDHAARGEVALLHGVMALADTWWRIGPALAQRGWRVTAIDLPGHAGDVRRDGALDLDALVDGVAQRVTASVDLLVGHSLGAIVALGLLARDPGLARALILEEPPGPSDIDLGALAAAIVNDAAAVRRDRAPLVAREREANPRWDPGDVERVRARHRGRRQRRDRRRPRRRCAGTSRPCSRACRSRRSSSPPPMLPAASRWTPAPRCAAPTATRCARRSRQHFVVLDGGHCLHRDDPARWLEVVEGFASAVLG